MAHRLRIGLTGGIASGKSTVAQRFIDLGIPVVDADDSSRMVVAPGQPGLAELTKFFGDSILTVDGELDRRNLRRMVFEEPQLRRELEAILHPLIQADMERRAVAAAGQYLVMAIPLLVESGYSGRADRILVVDVDEEVQIRRVMARDATTEEEARAILDAQTSRAARLKVADEVIVNSGTVSELREAVDALHEQYRLLAAANSPSNMTAP